MKQNLNDTERTIAIYFVNSIEQKLEQLMPGIEIKDLVNQADRAEALGIRGRDLPELKNFIFHSGIVINSETELYGRYNRKDLEEGFIMLNEVLVKRLNEKLNRSVIMNLLTWIMGFLCTGLLIDMILGAGDNSYLITHMIALLVVSSFVYDYFRKRVKVAFL